jgi:hypothetical protein
LPSLAEDDERGSDGGANGTGAVTVAEAVSSSGGTMGSFGELHTSASVVKPGEEASVSMSVDINVGETVLDGTDATIGTMATLFQHRLYCKISCGI